MPRRFTERLIVFTRYPEPGTTKTRLIPVLGAKGAADLQRKMSENTLSRARELSESRMISVEIRYQGGNEHLMREWLGPGYCYKPQDTGNIGHRMYRSFVDAFKHGADVAVIIGTDIPNITRGVLEKAFRDLQENDVVLGPAEDGGYYLIGLQREVLARTGYDLFSGIRWGAGDVLEKTLEAVRRFGLGFSLLNVLKDVDRPEDLRIWEKATLSGPHRFAATVISVIIPTLNEADHIRQTLASIGRAGSREVIVVDGGSRDNTAALAESQGATVLTCTPPRARQMNRGAAAATGEILFFVHADTRVPENFDAHIISALGKPTVVAGAFALRIDSPLPALRWIEKLANWRSRRFRLPYGDQGIFIRRERFQQMGGFPGIPIMEDFELARRLKKAGDVVTVNAPVYTSPRRWQRLGIFKTTLINQLVIAAYHAKISPHVIARWYRRDCRQESRIEEQKHARR